MIETPEAVDFGGTGQGIHPRKPDTHRRLRTRRVLRSLGSSARSLWRHREPGVDSQEAPCARDTVEDVHAKLRAIAGIAVLIALMAVGTTAAGAENATEQHPGVERLIDSSNGSDPDVAQVVDSSRDQTLRSRPSSSTSELEQVDLFGDSLGYQVEPYLDTFFAHSHDYTVSNYTYGGTATCDWLNTMEAAAAQRPQDALFVFLRKHVHTLHGWRRSPESSVLRPLYRLYRTGHRDLRPRWVPMSSWSGPRSMNPRSPGGINSMTSIDSWLRRALSR